MRKFVAYLFNHTKLFKYLAFLTFFLVFVFSVVYLTNGLSKAFFFNNIGLFILLGAAIAGLILNEYFSNLFHTHLGKVLSTKLLSAKWKKYHDKFFDLGVVMFFAAIGFDPIMSFIDKPNMEHITFKKEFYILSILIFVIYFLSVGIWSAYFYFKQQFKELKEQYLEKLNNSN